MADPKIVEYLSQIQRVVDRYTADPRSSNADPRATWRLVEDEKVRAAIRKEIAEISREMQEYRETKYKCKKN